MPKEEKRITFGQQVVDHWAKTHTDDDDVREYGRDIGRDIMKNVHSTVAQALTKDIYQNRDFYIVLMTNRDHMTGVPRSYVMARRSCPSAVYEQAVWKYHHASADLEFLWTIPSRLLYWSIVNNPQKYLQDKEYAGLAKFVLLMESGELLDWIVKENDEKPDGLIVYKDTGEKEKDIIQ